jgi:ATP-dependent protease Clp ATPase subunit
MMITPELRARPRLYCSFCARSEDETAKLFKSNAVMICRDCVDLLHEMMHEDEAAIQN